MLQQTQVERVTPKYIEWLEKFPTLAALAEAEMGEVKSYLERLGYNVRPERLHSIARETVAEYGGELPRAPEELQQFKGIGRYTAGAMASFAYGQDAAHPRYQRAPAALSRLPCGRRPARRGDRATAVGNLRARAAERTGVGVQFGANGFRRTGVYRAPDRALRELSDAHFCRYSKKEPPG